MGQGGRPFIQLRFRSGLDNSIQPPQFTMVGLMLENTGLVRLPYFLNVLKGDINLIGPIAFQPSFTEKYELEKIPGFTARYSVRPGFFSFAQFCGTKEDTPKRTIKYDLFYLKKRNLWLDLRLITRTLWDHSTKGTNRQWNQGRLPPFSKEIKEALASTPTLLKMSKTLNDCSRSYVNSVMTIRLIVYLVTYIGCWIYAVLTFSFFVGIGSGLLLSHSIATVLATVMASLLLIAHGLLGLSHNRAS
jgi:hypothetical protein